MTSKRPSFRKFKPQEEKIQQLEKDNPRFKRIYEEYESMSDQLWDLENGDIQGIPDDFLNAIKLQTEYLEDEIDDWLLDEKNFNQ